MSTEFSDIVTNWSDLTILPSEVHYLDFIRAGAVYHNIFKNEGTQDVLINNYVGKGLMPDKEFMDGDEFKEMVGNVKEMFS